MESSSPVAEPTGVTFAHVAATLVVGVVGALLGFLIRRRREARRDGQGLSRQQRQFIHLLFRRIEGLEKDLNGLGARYDKEMAEVRAGYEEESRKCERDRIELTLKLGQAEEKLAAAEGKIEELESRVEELMKRS